jgi:hypothetical protein
MKLGEGQTNKQELVRFQDLMAANMKMAVFWDVALRSLVEVKVRIKH